MKKAESFLKRIRWKAYFQENPDNDDSDQNNKNYGFKSNLTPPPNDYLNEFENTMYNMIKNIEFQSVRNIFQSKLKEDLKKVKPSGKIMVFASKTADMCKTSKEQCAKLINDNVIKMYQKLTASTKKKINKETKHLNKKLKQEKKMVQNSDQSAYVTLKDHKENFKIKLPCQLINPAKGKTEIVSKRELEKINRPITNWFKSISNKTKAQFTKFDIIEFYPSITKKLLDNALSYAQTLTTIYHDIIQVTKQARKSFLFTKGDIWMKKGENTLFDVTMGFTMDCGGLEACWYLPTWKSIKYQRQGKNWFIQR